MHEEVEKDLVIIGGGPAGLTAGLYASRARLDAVLLEKITPGGQLMVTDWVENYPGFPEGIIGAELVQRMHEQALRFGLNIETEEVTSIGFSDMFKLIHTTGKTIRAKSLIIASGASPKKLGIPGEIELFGKGVSTCATCDGPFYRERVVAAVGGGDTAVQESLFLTRFVKKVYLIHRRDELRATGVLRERAVENEKIEIVWDSVLKSVHGEQTVSGVEIENVKTGETKDLAVDGCFIWIGIDPNTGFLPPEIKVNEWGFIKVDENMESSVPGVYAAGDVRDTPLRQIATSVGDAAIASFSAEHYIQNFTRIKKP